MGGNDTASAEDVAVHSERAQVESQLEAARRQAARAHAHEEGIEVLLGRMAALGLRREMAVVDQLVHGAARYARGDPIVEVSRPGGRLARALPVPFELAQVVDDAAGSEDQRCLAAQSR